MKKLALWLVISLGLVNVANANGVCEEVESMKKIDYLHSIAVYTLYDYEELSKTLHNLILSHHIKEFKIDDKESICAYMNVFDMSFENVKLSQDEITKFERHIAERGGYERYEKNKDDYLQSLKFFTYYRNQIPSIYEAQDIYKVAEYLDRLEEYNGEIALYRYVYGKNQGRYMSNSSFDSFKDRVESEICSEYRMTEEDFAKCQKDKKILPPILKWAESNMKQPKQKGGQQ